MQPKPTFSLGLRISPELRDLIERTAEAQRLSISQVTRKALEEYFTEHDPDQAAA
jgi:uncharacterized protein (DUF1778 family)